MKAEIYRSHPKLIDAPDTIETLDWPKEAAKEAWHKIDQAIHQKLCDTMDHRVQAILAAEGWYMKY